MPSRRAGGRAGGRGLMMPSRHLARHLGDVVLSCWIPGRGLDFAEGLGRAGRGIKSEVAPCVRLKSVLQVLSGWDRSQSRNVLGVGGVGVFCFCPLSRKTFCSFLVGILVDFAFGITFSDTRLFFLFSRTPGCSVCSRQRESLPAAFGKHFHPFVRPADFRSVGLRFLFLVSPAGLLWQIGAGAGVVEPHVGPAGGAAARAAQSPRRHAPAVPFAAGVLQTSKVSGSGD